MWFDSFAIPRTRSNVEEAHAFIDFCSGPKSPRRTRNSSYANGNLEPEIDRQGDPEQPPSIRRPEMAKLYTVTRNPQTQRVINRVWTKFKTGK